MCLSAYKLVFSLIAVVCFIKTAFCINCYQCSGTDSNSPFQCNEFLDDNELEPQSCEGIYGAKYCIKLIGRFEATSILCYQCTSNSTINCGDGMIHMGGISPTSCDHVFEAQFCIKTTGGIGTKRYCSPLDLGNYCDYVKQPGDKLEYRSCVFTCTGDGCNSSITVKAVNSVIFSTLSFIFVIRNYIIR